jgi:hypothetical protein
MALAVLWRSARLAGRQPYLHRGEVARRHDAQLRQYARIFDRTAFERNELADAELKPGAVVEDAGHRRRRGHGLDTR